MNNNDKQIQEWQKKVISSFGDESKLYHYLFETMDNFYYRYLETNESKNLKTIQLGEHLWGAQSFESNMVDALKIKHPEAKKGIMELAKSIPKAQKPMVRYSLTVDVKKLTPDQGNITLESEINWDFPDYKDPGKLLKKSLVFKYDDLAIFRKQLALKLEEVMEIF